MAGVFDPNCQHVESNHNVIEYVVCDEEGRSRLVVIVQCNICGSKI